MNPTNRRDILAGFAVGASELLAARAAVAAEQPAFASGHTVLPAIDGLPLTRHKPEAPIRFKYAIDAAVPKITSGGWAREATAEQFPISQGIAGVHMYLNPGASRELHWHAIAAEWAYVLDGRCQTSVIDPQGHSEILNFGPGDVWFFPRGHGHSIQTIGNEPCHCILAFDNGQFSETEPSASPTG
jgi:oxalate decarboxylase